MKTPLLKVENFSKTYAPGQVVLSQVTFSLQAGEFLYVLGGSGAGKSSLLRTIATLDRPDSGVIRMMGRITHECSSSELGEVRRRISIIPQNLGLIPELTIAEHIQLVKSSTSSDSLLPDEEVMKLAQVMNLESKWNRAMSTLSGGEKQRVAILRALARKSDLIIADEPTGAQDFEMTWRLMDLFVKAQLAGTAILFATHDLEMVRRLRKRVAILKDGTMKVEV